MIVTKIKGVIIMAKQWLIRYYLTENAYKAGIPAFTETILGDRNFAINWAQNKLKSSQFKFYDLVEK
jgi:hypothetical protein